MEIKQLPRAQILVIGGGTAFPPCARTQALRREPVCIVTLSMTAVFGQLRRRSGFCLGGLRNCIVRFQHGRNVERLMFFVLRRPSGRAKLWNLFLAACADFRFL